MSMHLMDIEFAHNRLISHCLVFSVMKDKRFIIVKIDKLQSCNFDLIAYFGSC